jgi:pyruvate/2-oxoglutarate dehydrogenase complex dihydrolipoamide acyltransferase (E2) component
MDLHTEDHVMSIFGSIKDAIFGHAAPAPAAPAAPAAPHPAQTVAAAAPAQAAAHPAPAPAAPVDVEAILADKATKLGRPNNWRVSIVDLMTLLGLDSSREARTSLAHELGFTGDVHDSATMNIWLHKQVMTKLAENGGKVPADLMH